MFSEFSWTNKYNRDHLVRLSRFQMRHFLCRVVRFALPTWKENVASLKMELELMEKGYFPDMERIAALCDEARNQLSRRAAEGVESAAVAMQKMGGDTTMMCLRATECMQHTVFLTSPDYWEKISQLYSAVYRDGRVFPTAWKTQDTVMIADVIGVTNSLGDMPILADALEDAGCDDQEILCHLRQGRDLWTPADWTLVGLSTW